MLRFWLLEHTTATRSGDDGMAPADRPRYPRHPPLNSHLEAGFRPRKMAATGSHQPGSEGDVMRGEVGAAPLGPHRNRRGRAIGQHCVSVRQEQLRLVLVDRLGRHLTSQHLRRQTEHAPHLRPRVVNCRRRE